MIENSSPLSDRFESLQASSPEVPWVAPELSAQRFEVRGKRILLVEDQDLVRSALRMMLELDGHQVTEASNGAEALTSFGTGEFDLIITDFEMPMMKGNELAILIKRMAPALPILMITASERARGEVDNPVDALLSKPLTMPDLRGALGKLLPA